MKRNRPKQHATLIAMGPILDASIRFCRDFHLIAVGTAKQNEAIAAAFTYAALSAMGYDLGPPRPPSLGIEH